MPPAQQVHSRTKPATAPHPEGITVESVLTAWRRKASDVTLIVVAAGHVPVLVMAVHGYGPPMGPVLKVISITIYLVVAAAAALRCLDYRRRLLAAFLAIYVGFAITNLFFPHGPYAKGVITAPVFALVLLGTGAAKKAILASTAIIVAAPLLSAQPRIVRALGIDPTQVAAPRELVWFRITVVAASLLVLMVLLDRFHRFLLETLSQRIAAQQRMESEMRERQRLESKIAAIGDGERRRLGQELHDGVCQLVTAALLRCQALERRLQRGVMLSAADLMPLSSLLAETIDDARNVARGLCPLEPDADALAPALRALTRRTQEITGVRCDFLVQGDVRVANPVAAQHLYRIAQEAFSNAARHANATKITAELRGIDHELILQVEDDGAGLPAAIPTGGMGLRTMAYRAQIMNGEFTVGPAPGGGTRVTCRVPLVAPGLAVQPESGDELWTPAT